MGKQSLAAAIAAMALSCLPHAAAAQEGLGERIGKQLDQGFDQLSSEVKRTWAEIRESVDKFEVEGRVYSRLHWDKRLAEEKIDIEVEREGVVILTGTATDERAQRRAVQLTESTVGVERVVDRLQVATPR